MCCRSGVAGKWVLRITQRPTQSAAVSAQDPYRWLPGWGSNKYALLLLVFAGLSRHKQVVRRYRMPSPLAGNAVERAQGSALQIRYLVMSGLLGGLLFHSYMPLGLHLV